MLAALGILTIGNALAQARPPVKYSFAVPVEQVVIENSLYLSISPGDDFGGLDVISAGISKQSSTDAGMLCIGLNVRDLGSAIAIGRGHSWEIIRAPVSQLQAEAHDVWMPWSYQIDETERVVFSAVNYEGGITTRSIRELKRTGSGWTEREITRDVPSRFPIDSFEINNLGETAWIERDRGAGAYDGRIMIDRGTGGAPELLVSELEAVELYAEPHFEGGFGSLHRLFDDGSVMYSVSRDWGGVMSVSTGAGGEVKYVGSLSTHTAGPWSVWGNDQGDLFRGAYVFNWRGSETHYLKWYSADPSKTPAFTVRSEGSGFDPTELRSAAVGNNGRLLFMAKTPAHPNEAGLYAGPNPSTDAVVLPGDTLFGLPVSSLTLYSVNARDEFFFAFRYPIEIEGQVYNVKTPIIVGTFCPVDLNRDGFVDNGDLGEFVTAYLEGSSQVDFTNDGFIDTGDITEFVIQYLDGC